MVLLGSLEGGAQKHHRVVGDNKPISSDKSSKPLSINIIVSASMNDNTDLIQEENSLFSKISQHRVITASRYIRVAF